MITNEMHVLACNNEKYHLTNFAIQRFLVIYSRVSDSCSYIIVAGDYVLLYYILYVRNKWLSIARGLGGTCFPLLFLRIWIGLVGNNKIT